MNELKDEARDLILQGAALHSEAYYDEQHVITGFVLVIETMSPDGYPSLAWATGNGMPTKDGGGGLARWRISGMLTDVVQQMSALVTRWYTNDDHNPDGA